MTSIEIPISPRAVMEEAAHEVREEPEDWDAEIAADCTPPRSDPPDQWGTGIRV